MKHLTAVILAAGEGKRMKSKKSKVVHSICGKALIEWVYKAVDDAGVKDTVIVVGHRADQVKECMGERAEYVTQEKQLGTGHAVMQAEEHLKGKDGIVVVLCGDTPLITSDTISKAIKTHKDNKNAATVITAVLEDPSGYGRIIRDSVGNVLKIVEHRDATDKEKGVNEINSGMYCFTISDLLNALKELNNNNSQGEYYLTDTLEILIKKGLKVGAVIAEDSDEILGINDRIQLAKAGELLKKRVLNNLMMSGVTILDPNSTYIDEGVKIGMDTVIYPNTVIEGKTVIGENCTIGTNCRIVSSHIGNEVEVLNSVILESAIEDEVKIGPFAYIRPESKIGRKVKIGDFVEIKKSVIGEKTKIPHLTYVGDAEIGKNVNLGCGTIVVNYDGKKKHKTIVGDHAFVGCNSNLVSPVVVGEGAYIAAGSTITEEVPQDALAIARSRQVNKEDWVNKKGLQRK
ncbi:MAG: bifunctional UDP-N-acetylglucosamine diphosphorylase/glucosamine-1-phosphate N-acetyltransferase GlmU [Clostridia bacterium]|nr:bifunctional UDP-N-acetylglucosamine diphosphorylase/glucosamine-1-phosphate N-acetyltransferase GlmU [Clostridia bacterium]